MATYYSDETPQLLLPGDVMDSSQLDGKLKIARRNYTFVGTEAEDELWYAVWLPKGSTVITQLCYLISTTDFAGTCTCDVGDLDSSAANYRTHTADDDDRYASGLDMGAAGTDVFASGAAATDPHVLQEDTWITVKFETLTTPIADGVLQLILVYTDGGT